MASFLRDDDGAVTIDWTALTAGILLLGMAVVYAIFGGGVSGAVGGINGGLASALDGSGQGQSLCKDGYCYYDYDGDGTSDDWKGGVDQNGNPFGAGKSMSDLAADGWTAPAGAGGPTPPSF